MFGVIVLLIVYCTLGIVIQTTPPIFDTDFLAKPDFLVMLVIFVSLSVRNVQGLLLCFALGLIFDLSSAVVLGPNAAGAVFAFMFIHYVSQKMFAEQATGLFMLGLFVSFIKQAICLIFAVAFDINVGATRWIVGTSEAIFTAILTPFVVLSLFWLDSVSGGGRGVSSRKKKTLSRVVSKHRLS